MKRTTIIETIIFFYAILFLYTGISKLIDYETFRDSIKDSPILEPIATFIAWGLPSTEILVTTMLIIPRWRLKGLYASLLLMTSFTGYVLCLLLFDKELPCSCGGILQQLTWPQHLIFNITFLLLVITAIILQKREIKLQQSNVNFNSYRIITQQDSH